MSTSESILVADDSLTIRKLVESILSEEGYKVIAVETGAECLAQAAAQNPKLILLDYILPDMQGTDVCRKLINSPETWEIPVLMMSSNGNAIRQLYQDLNNVADYLTKPFAPSVLKAVVGHLMQKGKPGENTEAAPAEAPADGAPAVPAAEAANQEELMSKVTRLLSLMENKPQPGEAAAQPETTDAEPAKAAAKPKSAAKPRKKKTVAAAPTPEAMLRKFRTTLQKHLRLRMHHIPDWEAVRSTEDPESFYLSRILSKDVLADLSADLLRVLGMPTGAGGVMRFPFSLVPLDTVLRNLQSSRATGELRVELENETVLLCLEQGEVILITSNNPKNYCAGTTCDFQQVPHAIIGDAVRAQQEQSLPLFLSLMYAGHLPVDAALEQLLRDQGERCMMRAFNIPSAVAVFTPLAKLSNTARSCKLNYSINQLLLICYRTVDDWLTLEKSVQNMETTLIPLLDLRAQLDELTLNAEESRLLAALSPGQTILELAAAIGLRPYETCRLLFRFIKLGFIQLGPVSSRANHFSEDRRVLPGADAPAMWDRENGSKLVQNFPATVEAAPAATDPVTAPVPTETPAPAPTSASTPDASAGANNAELPEPAPVPHVVVDTTEPMPPDAALEPAISNIH